MKISLVSLVALFICINTNAQQASPIADSNNIFALNLYNHLRQDSSKKNLFFSPFSISTTLAMTYAGARGQTEKQMCSTLHFSLNQDQFHREYKAYISGIDSDAGRNIQLGIANSLWIANALSILTPFAEIVKDDYNSESKNVDFGGHTEKVRREINTWVEIKTNDKIKNLIQPRIIGTDTKLVLVNAIYFKGKWAKPFSKDSTKFGDFHENSIDSNRAEFMHNTAHYKYYGDTLLQAIEIPYASDKMSMIVLLPKDINGMANLENELGYSYYSKIVSSLHSQKVIVTIPKFKTTVAFELSKTLSDMGMPDAFADADFSGISNENLSISNVIHKAFIDVNEEGTEAAAATAIVMTFSVEMPPKLIPVFNASHPFIFIIKDNTTGSILFMGKIADPTKE